MLCISKFRSKEVYSSENWANEIERTRSTFEERTPEETSRQEECARKAAWDLARKYITQGRGQIYVFSHVKKRHRCWSPKTQKNVCLWLIGSFNAHVEQEGSKLIWNGYFAEVQERHCGACGQWRSADNRGSTSVRSRSRSVRRNYSKKRQQFYRLESLAQNTDVHMSGKTAKLHNWPKMGKQLLVQWTASYLLSYQDCHHLPAAARLPHRDQRISPILPVNPKQHQIQWRLDVPSMRAGNRYRPTLASKPWEAVDQHTEDETDKEDPTQGILDWLQPFTANLEDVQTCARAFLWKSELRFGRWGFKSGDTKTETLCSYSLPQKPKRDLFCDQKSMVTWQQQSTFLSEGSEFRNHHRYAVVVQDLATQWIQSHRCKTQTSQETQKSLQKFLEPTTKPKVIYTDNSPEFGKYCEDLAWNHSSSKPHRSETGRIAEKEVRRIKEGTSAVLLQSGLDEKWWADSMECCCFLRNIQDLLSDGKTLYERRFGVPFTGRVTPFGAMEEYHLISAQDLSRLHQFSPKVLPGIFPGYALHVGVNLERRHHKISPLKSQKFIFRTIHWNLGNPVSMESSSVYTLSLRNKRNCRTSFSTSFWGNVSCIIAKSGLDDKWWSDSMECYCYLRNVQDLLADGKTPYERRFGESFKGSIMLFDALIGSLPKLREKQSKKCINWKEITTRNFYRLCFTRGRELGKKIFWLLMLKNWKIWRHRNIFQKTEHKRSLDNPQRWRICISCGRWFSKIIRKKLRIPRTHSGTGIHRKERES